MEGKENWTTTTSAGKSGAPQVGNYRKRPYSNTVSNSSNSATPRIVNPAVTVQPQSVYEMSLQKKTQTSLLQLLEPPLYWLLCMPPTTHDSETKSNENKNSMLSWTTTTTQRMWLQLDTGRIYEVAGEAGSGKTQVALTLCLQIMLQEKLKQPKKSCHHAYYLSLKGGSAVDKILQRLGQMSHQHQLSKEQLRRVFIKTVPNVDDLEELISKELPRRLLEEKSSATSSTCTSSNGTHVPRLLIIDSIADLFRASYNAEGTSTRHRAVKLFQISSSLKRLCRDHPSLSVVVLNQVTAAGFRDTAYTDSSSPTAGVTPALGLAWAHCVDSSFLLTKTSQQQRILQLVRSPQHAAPQSIGFDIQAGGVFLSGARHTSSREMPK